MAYIGKQPTTGDFVLLDSITTSATASYTMQRNSVNFEPQSANHMIVSLNGTIQAPVSSFTVSGSTLTFASALTSSDVIDFILVLGNVNDVGTATTVVDSAITKNKLDLISTSGSPGLTVKGDGSSENGTLALNCSQNSHAVKISAPAHSAGQSYELILPTGNVTADKFLKVASVSGSGATGIGQLSFADAGGGLVQTGRSIISSSTAAIYLDDIFSTTYNNYIVMIRNMTPTSDEDDWRFRVNVSGTAKSDAKYNYQTEFLDNGGGSQGHFDGSNDTEFKLGHDIDYESWKGGYNAMMHCTTHLSDTSNLSSFNYHGTATFVADDGVHYSSHFAGVYRNSARPLVTGLDFYYNSGQIARGEITCYGLVIS